MNINVQVDTAPNVMAGFIYLGLGAVYCFIGGKFLPYAVAAQWGIIWLLAGLAYNPIVGLALGGLCGFCCFKLKSFYIGLIGATFGAALGMVFWKIAGIAALTNNNPTGLLVVVLLFAITAGVLSCKYADSILIYLTAIIGSFIIGVAVLNFAGVAF